MSGLGTFLCVCVTSGLGTFLCVCVVSWARYVPADVCVCVGWAGCVQATCGWKGGVYVVVCLSVCMGVCSVCMYVLVAGQVCVCACI